MNRPRITFVAELGGSMGLSLLRGFNRKAVQYSWLVQWLPHWGEPEIESIHEWDPHVIVANPCEIPEAAQAVLRNRAVVSVEADRRAQGFPSILIDDQAVGAEAARHLLSKGLRHLAAFGHAEYPFSADRVAGFRAAVEAAGVQYHAGDEWIRSSYGGIGCGTVRWKRWLLELPKPVGVFSTCDSWAVKILNLCQMAGIIVPDQVAVVGACDDAFHCDVTHPRLSSVPIPFEELGQRAAMVVLDLLEGRAAPVVQVVRPTAVAARASSDVPMEAPPAVRAALRYIAEHASSNLGVRQIVAHSLMSRRALEQSFRRYLGSTLLDEIQKVKLRRAAELLVSTELPMHEIAEAAGFGTVRGLHRVFRSEMGTTPDQYRQRFRRW